MVINMKKLIKRLGIHDVEDLKKFIVQFIKFSIVGLSNTIIFLITYYILLFFDFHYIIANSIGGILGILNSYIWNSRHVFKTENTKIKVLCKTFIAYSLTFIISNLILFLLVSKLNISELFAPLLALLITVPFNFLLNKFWAYK